MKVTNLFETAKNTDERLLSIKPELRMKEKANPSCKITLDNKIGFQSFNGFGGALTEAAGYVLSKMPEALRNEAVEAFYNQKKGNGYVFARTHMNSCDFSLGNWSCVPEKDETLDSFSMERTDKYMTPLLNAAQEACLKSGGNKLNVMVTPWSPPTWMKDNNDMNHGGHLKSEYKELWAKYFVKYLKELKKRNIDVGIVSIQNEPQAVQTWDSCIWTAEEESEFAVKFLKKALVEGGFADTKILVWDHNRDLLWERFSSSMAVPGADKAIDGAAYHWYIGANYQNVKKIAEKYPDKLLVFTEGSVEGGSRNGAWFTGERYAHNIINDLNSGCNTWIDWNIALDMQGGPNHVGNYCDSTLLCDTEKGVLNFQSSYYYIGHFSRFIRPGAVRIGCNLEGFMTPATVDGIMGDYMESTAFINKDGSIALVVCNRTEADMNYVLSDGNDEKSIILCCPPRAIQTVLLRL